MCVSEMKQIRVLTPCCPAEANPGMPGAPLNEIDPAVLALYVQHGPFFHFLVVGTDHVSQYRNKMRHLLGMGYRPYRLGLNV